MKKDISIYIHIPFCIKKCTYCDFISFDNKNSLKEKYIDSLLKEISLYISALEQYNLKSVFFGGGTPTVINERSIDEILQNIYKAFKIDKEDISESGIEVSIEGNPGALTERKIKKYLASGVNRLSLGLQTINTDELQVMGRIHTAEEFYNSYNLARKNGFENINIDIIFGIPGQTVNTFKKTLNAVIEMNPEHISCYSLKLEEGTKLYKRVKTKEIQEISDEMDRKMYHLAVSELKKAGYIHYEISNFARTGFECRHNKVYWTGGEYLGLGAGAHSYMNGTRFNNKESIEEYINMLENSEKPVSNEEKLSIEEKMSEYMILGLRLIKGISISGFEETFHEDISAVYGKKIDLLLKKKLIKKDENSIVLTKKGLDLANQVFIEFI
jgi:oxygen-independent coproporphyrinogen-3 oxidase